MLDLVWAYPLRTNKHGTTNWNQSIVILIQLSSMRKLEKYAAEIGTFDGLLLGLGLLGAEVKGRVHRLLLPIRLEERAWKRIQVVDILAPVKKKPKKIRDNRSRLQTGLFRMTVTYWKLSC